MFPLSQYIVQGIPETIRRGTDIIQGKLPTCNLLCDGSLRVFGILNSSFVCDVGWNSPSQGWVAGRTDAWVMNFDPNLTLTYNPNPVDIFFTQLACCPDDRTPFQELRLVAVVPAFQATPQNWTVSAVARMLSFRHCFIGCFILFYFPLFNSFYFVFFQLWHCIRLLILSFFNLIFIISALEALRDALYKSTTTTATTIKQLLPLLMEALYRFTSID